MATSLAALLSLGVPAIAADLIEAHPWLAFEGLAVPPLTFETRIPAESAFTEGPDGARAVAVRIADLSRDEQACAAHLDLPPLDVRRNALRLWVRGSENTKRLEIVIRTTAGSFAGDVPLTPQWTQATLSPHNTTPWFSSGAMRLDVSQATQLRFCIGLWQGHSTGPHEFSLGPIEAIYSPLFALGPPPQERDAQEAPIPLQPFTVELLDLYRGQWQFIEPLGSRLLLPGPVTAYAFGTGSPANLRLAYLCCDPEFPDDPRHATLKVADVASTEGDTQFFRLDEPYLSCGVTVRPEAPGVVRCELRDIALGPATTGAPYVAALYVLADDHLRPVWLLPSASASVQARLLTNRVGNVFVEDEPCRITLIGLNPRAAQSCTFTLQAGDYLTKQTVWHERIELLLNASSATSRELTVPLKRFGIFEVAGESSDGPVTPVRVCRLPRPRPIDPDASSVGINLFQQQLWWYAYQVPLMQKAGVHWLRPWLAWENTWRIQEPKPGEWDTRALDAALRRMESHGLRYEYILFAAPDWVADPGRSSVPPIEKMSQWAGWVEKLISRYRGRINVWEVWNEPDLMWPEDSRHSGEHYLEMLRTTYAAAKRADPNCTVQGLSHAGYEDWLVRVGDLGAARYMDQATIHTYALPPDFPAHVTRRLALLAQHGLGDKPVWINEFGAPAYDFSPAYSEKMHCSERKQAFVLVANYAQAFALTGGKAFWFCTLDPRDPAHESQWTWDAGIGVLYQGLLPKLSYAALAGVSHELDGRPCGGLVDVSRTLHYVSFDGPVSVVWTDDPQNEGRVAAASLGCAADEQLAVRDMFTNPVTSGRAKDLTLNLSTGPLYLSGSRQLLAVAKLQSAFRVEPAGLSLDPGGQASVTVHVPAEAHLTLTTPAGLSASESPAGRARRVTVAAPADASRSETRLILHARAEAGLLGLLQPIEMDRAVNITVGAPNLIRDGAFARGNLLEWSPERTSPYVFDAEVGHAAPGSLRLDGPFDRRLVQFGLPVDGTRALHLSFWVRTDSLGDCEITANLALHSADRWLGSPCLASTKPPAVAPNPIAAVPTGTADWTRIEVTLNSDLIPDDTQHGSFYLDAKGDTAGRIWFDDLDLWQDR